MEFENLVSLEEWVRMVKAHDIVSPETQLSTIFKYEELLSSELKLWMIHPCDEEGNRLPEPDGFGFWWMDTDKQKYENHQECEEYLAGKRRMLFVLPIYVTADPEEILQDCSTVGRLAHVFRETKPTNQCKRDLGLYVREGDG
jgi:hypothetical protein